MLRALHVNNITTILKQADRGPEKRVGPWLVLCAIFRFPSFTQVSKFLGGCESRSVAYANILAPSCVCT